MNEIPMSSRRGAALIGDHTYPIEPNLVDVVIEKHKVGTDENGRFAGSGSVKYRNGNVYKGEFVDGKMHGQGVYNWTNGVVYKGDFTHNKITGKGSYTWPNGVVYEGEVFEGKRHGMGTLTLPDPSSVYSGMWHHGKRHGKGKLSFDRESRSYFLGDFVDDERCGNGKMVYASGNVYEGEWKGGLRSGTGTMHWKERGERYVGSWKNGLQHGPGEHIWFIEKTEGSPWQNYNRYHGNWFEGARHGHGTFEYADGSRYVGEWVSDKKHGKGCFYFANGTEYNGPFEKDRMVSYKPPAQGREQGGTAGSDVVLDIDDLLIDYDQPEDELHAVKNVVLQSMSELKQIYRYYSRLDGKPAGGGNVGSLLEDDGKNANMENAFAMSMLEFWKFAKDSKLPDHVLTLAAIDRIFFLVDTKSGPETPVKVGKGKVAPPKDAHNPNKELVFREFVEGLVRMSDIKFPEFSRLSERLSRAVAYFVLPNAMKDEVDTFRERIDSPEVKHILNKYDEQLQKAYRTYCSCRHHIAGHDDWMMNMRDFLKFLKLNKLIDEHLTYSAVVDIFLRVNQDDGTYLESNATNLDLELIFPEFTEGLCRVAERRHLKATGEEIEHMSKGLDELADALFKTVFSQDQAKLLQSYDAMKRF